MTTCVEVVAPADSAAAARRRRLWDLPAQAHDVLLAMSFTPETLRREVARALGVVHKARCALGGRDVDVLYAAVHELTARNALSERLQRCLDERHALALRHWQRLRGRDALLATWQAARDADTLPADLWSLLTHPLGRELERQALYDARAWVFRHARDRLSQTQARHEWQLRAMRAEHALDEVRARLILLQRQADASVQQLRTQLAASTGEAARWRARTEDRTSPASAAPEAAQTPGPSPTLPSPTTRDAPSAASAPAPTAPTTPSASSAPARLRAPEPHAALASASAASQPKPEPIVGRNILCVGGIRHAVGRYRLRVERLGARFEHHDGGIEDGIQGLDGRLSRADLVICQAACINHEAYHRIKRHCERTGKPCLYLERPSLAQFDRALMAWSAPQRVRARRRRDATEPGSRS